MKNDITKIIYTISLLWIILGCERDDICPGEVPDTPQLIIRFYDNANPEEVKSVTSLRVLAAGVDVPVPNADRVTTDSIALPLRSFENETAFTFILNSEDDANGAEIGNSDRIAFNYTTKEVFISRACGFVANYENLTSDLTTDTNNWIQSVEIINDTIANENTAHVKIFH
ncbi:DUF6452 family protein [Leptobacterium sp. I13]|uniref:DUF6452 family protein n=1 Tax=Leptobacterium meishanense TaxID=3128904 RepID=UPI0030ED56D0